MRKDIDLSFNIHPLTGDIATKRDISAINQSLRNIVLTIFYERGYNVSFGTNVRSSLFENNYGGVFEQGLRQNVLQAIENFEPYVDIEDVQVYTQEEHTLVVDIYYTLINNLEEQRLTINLQE